MTLPKQPTNVDENRRALAPYNFVPLPENIIRLNPDKLPDHDIYDHKRHSGYIECELTTASPIYTRGMLTPDDYAAGAESKDQSAFFYVQDEDTPVIPGTSLRGMLRHLVEIVTYSKISDVSDEKLVYRAVGDTTDHGNRYRDRLMRDDGNKQYTPRIKGGYIEKDQYGNFSIRPAKEIGGTTYAHWNFKDRNAKKAFLHQLKRTTKNAYEVFIQTGAYDYQQVRGGFIKIRYAPVLRAEPKYRDGLQKGVAAIAESGWINSKRTEAVIYEANPSAELISISDKQVDLYRDQLSKEQVDLLGHNGALRQGQPVFYVTDALGNLEFFGHCRMFRLPYLKSPLDFVPPHLRRKDDCDLAEAIFGYTNKDGRGKKQAYAGRVRVSDATIQPNQKDIWLTRTKIVVPQTLGGPKPTTFQHYLVQPKPNYKQVGRTRDGKPKYQAFLEDYTAGATTMIRGHKLYWHKGNRALDEIRETKPLKGDDKTHTRIQPLRTDVQFNFRLDFDNLALVELGALLWILDVASDPAYRLKIGMGKPLGMGAIQIRSKLFIIDRQQRYQTLLSNDSWATHEEVIESSRADIVTEFERFVLRRLGSKAAQQLKEIDRIGDLLRLLSWPGPNPERTRYMEIERWEGRRKRNEYRDRPVLPVPARVAGETATATATIDEPQRATKSVPADYEQGVVKFFNNRGFGFIERERGKDIFVHKSQLRGVQTLRPNQRVMFKIGPGMKGDEAKDVQIIE